MKDTTEKKTIDTLYLLNQPATTQQVADLLKLSRSVTSNYLNRLYEKNLVTKNGTKPIQWCLVKKLPEKEIVNTSGTNKNIIFEEDVFSKFIGATGSQKNVIQQCKAAITYPPNGLTILLNGESGVGKSYLALLIHKYAIQKNVIKATAPFKILNCADYANNPELLSATLFGYKKGSFTGADSDHLGLLDYANGGYLFLDEIHRFSFENQEKLFVFMDSGKYQRLGESEKWQNSCVRLIFATTENNKEVLLETFRRRISVKISISNMSQRSYYEKINLITLFYRQEAKRLEKNIQIQDNVVKLLASGLIEGNIGGIRNTIQLSCANAFVNDKKNCQVLKITLKEIPQEYLRNIISTELNYSPLEIKYQNNNVSSNGVVDNKILLIHIIDFKEKLKKIEENNNQIDLIISFKKLIKVIKNEKNKGWMFPTVWSDYMFKNTKDKITKFLAKYGVVKNSVLVQELMDFLILFYCSQLSEFDFPESKRILVILKTRCPKSCYITNKWKESNALFQEVPYDLISILYIFALQNVVDEKINLSGLLIAHGNSTATSIREVVNDMYETFVFEAFDMPITISVTEIIIKVKEYLRYFDVSNGLILIIDMGSLGQIYSSIKDNIGGELLILNNLTTSVALDIGMKIINNIPFKIIANESDGKYKIESQYFEAGEKNIIISCMSGIGIAEKVKELFSAFINLEKLKIITLEYKKVKDLFDTKHKINFSNTCLLITTNDLDNDVEFPCLNIYDALKENGEKILWDSLKPFIDYDNFQQMMKDFVKFFSIEGVASRLKILNPAVVIPEAELIIDNYVRYYDLNLRGYERLNIFMHISVMVERLISNNEYEDINLSEMTEMEKEFFNISKDILRSIEEKFNIKINQYEIQLLFEILRNNIQEKSLPHK